MEIEGAEGGAPALGGHSGFIASEDHGISRLIESCDFVAQEPLFLLSIFSY